MHKTKKELDAEITGLRGFARRLSQLPLPESELELLASLIEGHVTGTRSAWMQERLERAIDLLVPTYDGRVAEELKPSRWPTKAWWWTGASIRDAETTPSGDVVLSLSSYVGRGQTDDLDGFVIQKAWLEADDLKSAIQEACRIEWVRREVLAQAEKIANARRELERALSCKI